MEEMFSMPCWNVTLLVFPKAFALLTDINALLLFGLLYDPVFHFLNLNFDSFHAVKECTESDAVQESEKANEVQFYV